MSCKQCEQLGLQLKEAWEKILVLDEIETRYRRLVRKLRTVYNARPDDRTILLFDVLEDENGLKESGESTLETPSDPGEESEGTEGEGLLRS